jgi:hypothetical protein
VAFVCTKPCASEAEPFALHSTIQKGNHHVKKHQPHGLDSCRGRCQPFGRGIQNWTGTNGVMEVYAGEKLVRRFIKVDKVSTALGTDDGKARAYRYGYGVLDENFNFEVDPGEKKVYFEVSDYSNTVFFESPR